MTDQSQTRPLTTREQIISAIRDNVGKANMLAQDGDDWVDATADAMVKIMEAADYDERRRMEFLERRNRDGAQTRDGAEVAGDETKPYCPFCSKNVHDHCLSSVEASNCVERLPSQAAPKPAPDAMRLLVSDSFRVIEKSTGEDVTDWDIIGQLTAQKIADQAYLLDRRSYEVRDGTAARSPAQCLFTRKWQ